MQKTQDSNAASYSKSNAVSRTIAKGSHLYKNSSWDLVDAEAEVGFNYDDLKIEDLPENLKDKSMSEIKAFVKEKKREREQIQNKISGLNKKRREYLINNRDENSNGFESAMIKALKKQAEKKNYTWN